MILKQKLNLHPEVDPLNDWLVVLSMVADAGNRPFKRTRSLNVRPFRSGGVDFADQHDAGARSRRRAQYGPDSMSRGNNAETRDPSAPVTWRLPGIVPITGPN